jgi:hypothetical protein
MRKPTWKHKQVLEIDKKQWPETYWQDLPMAKDIDQAASVLGRRNDNRVVQNADCFLQLFLQQKQSS